MAVRSQEIASILQRQIEGQNLGADTRNVGQVIEVGDGIARVWGLSDAVRKLTDVRVAIRRYGSAESLNVGVACGILLSGLHRKMDEHLTVMR